MPERDEYDVDIGVILGTRGLHGDLVVQSLSDVPGRFESLEEVWLQPRVGPGWLARIVRIVGRTSKGHLVIHIEGIENVETARRLRGAALRIPSRMSPPLPEGEYYEWQIIGLEVVTSDGRRLGAVEEIIHTGANDVYVVGRYLIPAISQVIKKVDLERGEIVIEPMPGLLEEAGGKRHEKEAEEAEAEAAPVQTEAAQQVAEQGALEEEAAEQPEQEAASQASAARVVPIEFEGEEATQPEQAEAEPAEGAEARNPAAGEPESAGGQPAQPWPGGAAVVGPDDEVEAWPIDAGGGRGEEADEGEAAGES